MKASVRSLPLRTHPLVLGVVLLPFTLHLADERILGAVLLIGLGALLIWRRAR